MAQFYSAQAQKAVENAKEISLAEAMTILSNALMHNRTYKPFLNRENPTLDNSVVAHNGNLATVITELGRGNVIVQTFSQDGQISDMFTTFDCTDSFNAISAMDSKLPFEQMAAVAKNMGNYDFRYDVEPLFNKGDKIPDGYYLALVSSDCRSTYDGAGVEYKHISTLDVECFPEAVYKIGDGLPTCLNKYKFGTAEELSKFFGLEWDKTHKEFGSTSL